MNMDIFSVIGIALVSAVLCLLLKQYKPEYAMVASIACGVLIFSMVLGSMLPLLHSVTRLLETVSAKTDSVKAIVKTLGVCYVTQLASDACRDAGQTAIASKVELAGKVCILLLALPLFQQLLEIAFGLIQSGA